MGERSIFTARGLGSIVLSRLTYSERGVTPWITGFPSGIHDQPAPSGGGVHRPRSPPTASVVFRSRPKASRQSPTRIACAMRRSGPPIYHHTSEKAYYDRFFPKKDRDITICCVDDTQPLPSQP